jgi:glutaconate CoA-transferase subunit B
MAVVTNMGVMKFEEESKRMYLAEVYPGVAPEQLAENTGFPLDVSAATESAPPSPEELRILRQEVDPQRLILGPMPENE